MGTEIRYPRPKFPKIAEMLRAAPWPEVEAELRKLTPGEVRSMLSSRDLWALDYQRPPSEPWSTWIMRFGRGGGKTQGGGAWINEMAEDREALGGGDLALMGPTYADTTKTMVRGISGVLATARPDFMPTLKTRDGTLILEWPNKVIGHILSEDARERGRGLNLAGFWGDEMAAWLRPAETYDEILMPALRLGPAQSVITTTPKPIPYLEEIEQRTGTIVTCASTFDNCYLAPQFRQRLIDTYGGTRLEKQELFGMYLGISEHALWTPEDIEGNRARHDANGLPRGVDLQRIVVAIDPAATDNPDSDETGIVVAGIDYDGICYVMADITCKAKPTGWAKRAVMAFHRFKADAIVAEVNNGGDMVATTIRAVWESAPVIKVRASRGKAVRAEPVSALTQQGRVKFCGEFPELEKQLVGWDPTNKKAKSPDRLDAFVWAVHELALQDGNAPTIMGYKGLWL